MPTHAASNQAIQQMYINGHFCYAYKFGIITICGSSIVVIMLASQAEDTGSIPAYRFIFFIVHKAIELVF